VGYRAPMPQMTSTAPRAAAPAPPASGAREVELKLHVDARDLPRVLTLPALAGRAEGPAVTRAVRTVYYDTPDLRLLARGVALRIRHENGARVQGVKTMGADAAGDSAGIAVRQEWESPLPGHAPDFALLDAGGGGALIPADARESLGVIFETDLRRTTLLVRLDSLTTVEVAVDEGRVQAGPAAEAVAEVELELKSGRASRLFELALALQDAVPVRIGTENKAEVGYRLVTGRTPAPVLPEPLALSPLTTVAEAFRHIVRHALRHLLANEACALARGDTEGLHQIRVALRRLRTAQRLFGPLVGAEAADGFRRDLRRLASRLRAAREWDVLLAALLAPGAPAAAESLTGAAHDARRAPLDEAVAAIRAPRCTGVVLRLAAWLEDGRWHADAAARAVLDRPMSELAGPWLTGLHARARKAGKDAGTLDEAGRERLRRRLRRLNYTVEFFRGLYPPDSARAYGTALAALLDALDAAHDATVAAGRLAGLDAPGARATAKWLGKRAAQRHRALPALWKAFKDAPPFWEFR